MFYKYFATFTHNGDIKYFYFLDGGGMTLSEVLRDLNQQLEQDSISHYTLESFSASLISDQGEIID